MCDCIQLWISLSSLQVGNAAVRRPELFGQFDLCQAQFAPRPAQGNSKKIANIVHTFTLPIVFILIGTTLLMNAVWLQGIRSTVLITCRNSEVFYEQGESAGGPVIKDSGV